MNGPSEASSYECAYIQAAHVLLTSRARSSRKGNEPTGSVVWLECRVDGLSWLKGTCVPAGMEDVCLRHTRTVLHKQAPACVACLCMERQFSGMNKIVMADSEVPPTLQQRHGTALLVPMGPFG